MVEHRLTRRLACHHCGHAEPTPRLCPECQNEDSLVACGPGVERIADEVAERFPDKRTIVLSSDFPGGTERLRITPTPLHDDARVAHLGEALTETWTTLGLRFGSAAAFAPDTGSAAARPLLTAKAGG